MQAKFKKYNTHFVYMYAPEDIIIQREKDRADRLVGHTINLLRLYDSQALHDIHINTTNVSPKEVAQEIISQLRL